MKTKANNKITKTKTPASLSTRDGAFLYLEALTYRLLILLKKCLILVLLCIEQQRFAINYVCLVFTLNVLKKAQLLN